MKRIIVFSTDGAAREDGNVYYSSYVVVESTSPALTFGEPIFVDPDSHEPQLFLSRQEWIDRVRALGYTVEEPECLFITVEADPNA